jgi:cytochrome c-type biogenesis protein CcmH/NrfF
MKLAAVLIWVLPLVVIVMCIVMVLLGAGCSVYERPCVHERAQFVELAEQDGGR